MISKKVLTIAVIVFAATAALSILAGFLFDSDRRPSPVVIQCPADPRCPPIVIRETFTETRQEFQIEPKLELEIKPETQPQPELQPKPQPKQDFYKEPEPEFPSAEELAEFRAWAEERGIILQGIKTDIDSLFYNKYNPATDNVELEMVPGVMEAYAGLKVLPDSVLEVMRDKTVYLSTIAERPFTFTHGEYAGLLKGVTAGIVVTNPVTAQNTIHEFGHILGYNGIEGIYDSNYPQFKIFREEYDRIFDTGGIEYMPNEPEAPEGYISRYATANKAENFAEHFAYYVTAGDVFRSVMVNNPALTEKYNFFKNNIFGGREY